jgi:outer membrane protein OmpA-like peptidoglycan-associated protein
MFAHVIARSKAKSEAERPFWISYADLMTAMMTLCLVVMAVTIISITKKLDEKINVEEARAQDIRHICSEIQTDVGQRPNINVNCEDNRIDFGEAGRFDYKDYHLRTEVRTTLAALVPTVLAAANSKLGQKWLKQVVIEGFTDPQGPYLYNLNLSLERSYFVMCTLVGPRAATDLNLSDEQIQQVRELFLAGGVSFNDAKDTDEASRRVELHLQFYSLDEKKGFPDRPRTKIQSTQQDKCELP